jgi:hypothetical protein
MPDGGDVEELEGTLEGEVDGEHDEAPDVAGYLHTGEEYLRLLEEQAKQAGRETGLAGLRKAVKRTTRLVEEAEQRGYARARSELHSEVLDEATREQLKAEYVAELRGQDAARRNAMRLGVPEALLGNFEGLGPDFKDWERRAAELHAAGIHWGDADPLVAQVARERAAAWQQQAAQAQQNGQGVSLDPAGPVPEQVREQVIAEATAAFQRAQAGGQPPGAHGGIEEDIQKATAAAERGQLTEEAAFSIADRFNRELDALSRAERGVWG